MQGRLHIVLAIGTAYHLVLFSRLSADKSVAMKKSYSDHRRCISITQTLRLTSIFFSNCICNTCNALRNTVVEASSLNTFNRLLDSVDPCQFAVLPHHNFVVFFVLWASICKWSCCPVCPVRYFLIKL